MSLVKRLASYAVFEVIGFRPAPVPAQEWDREYREGRWDYLGDMTSIGGLASVIGYCQFLNPSTILDVGCGAGVLASRLKLLPYTQYLGVDISAEAIAQAQGLADDRTAFAVAGAEEFHTDRRFDVVIFSQLLNYIDRPDELAARYARYLTVPRGRIVAALFDAGRTRAAWRLIERKFRVEDSMRIVQGPGSTTTKVLVPR